MDELAKSTPEADAIQARVRRRLSEVRDRIDIVDFAAHIGLGATLVADMFEGCEPAGLAFVAALESEIDEPIWPRLRNGVMVETSPAPRGGEGPRFVDADTVEDLAAEKRGRWMVYTESGSRHLIDLSLRVTQRFPPPGAPDLVLPNEARSLRSIERAHVGETGYWTMHSSDWLIDYLWHLTSTITRIERLA